MAQVLDSKAACSMGPSFSSTQSGVWGERLDRAKVFPDKATAAAGLETGRDAEKRNEVLDLYAIDVSTSGGAIMPLKLREAIRARGPTIHPEFTKPGSAPASVQEDDHVSV